MSLQLAFEKLSPVSEFSMYILLSLYEGENHGYGIVVKTRRLTSGRLELKTATVYSAINRFIDYGLVKLSNEHEGKKFYELTNDGVIFVKNEYEKIKLLEHNAHSILSMEESL